MAEIRRGYGLDYIRVLAVDAAHNSWDVRDRDWMPTPLEALEFTLNSRYENEGNEEVPGVLNEREMYFYLIYFSACMAQLRKD